MMRKYNSEVFDVKDFFNPQFSSEQIKQIPVLALAHIGDAVFELLARCHILEGAARNINSIHKMTVALVCANAQCSDVQVIMPFLSEEEKAIFIRGRNAKPKTIPKNSSHATYAFATGLEVLFGWLYVNGKIDRINELFNIIIQTSEGEAISDV